jgi:myo-inositol-1(or 4)-monophosphatase
LIAGAIYAPALDEMYLCVRGAGATRNGAAIHVSPTADLDDSLIVTGFPYNRKDYIDALMGMFGGALQRTQGVLRLGSAALDFAAVASGHLEAFYEHGLKPWDMAAGALLVEEAGGKVTGLLEGESFSVMKGRMVASNGKVHEDLQRAIRSGAEKMPPLDWNM